MEVVRFVFGIFGNATALFLFLSPLVTFQRIIRKRSTEDFSGVPYNMTLLNCLLSAWYGLPFVSPNNLLVSTINGAGSAIEAVYVLIFLVFAPKKERARVAALFTFVLSVFAVIALVSLLALRGQRRKLFCGFAAAIFSICMYASPLSIMRLVIKTKSVEYMPFLLSLFVFLCGTSWFVYGLLGGDPFVTVVDSFEEWVREAARKGGGGGNWKVPNGCGSALGAIQLILYAIYRNHTTTDGGSEMNGQGHKQPEDDSRATEKKPDHQPIADKV